MSCNLNPSSFLGTLLTVAPASFSLTPGAQQTLTLTFAPPPATGPSLGSSNLIGAKSDVICGPLPGENGLFRAKGLVN
jgi:hypothetical protein